jgi:hypothetical protein
MTFIRSGLAILLIAGLFSFAGHPQKKPHRDRYDYDRVRLPLVGGLVGLVVDQKIFGTDWSIRFRLACRGG